MARFIEEYYPELKQDGLQTAKPVVLSGTSATLAVGGTLAVTGTSTFTGAATFTAAPTFSAGISGQTLRPVTQSALVGATVALTAAQSGTVFNNRSTSGSPSWTLPTAANGL